MATPYFTPVTSPTAEMKFGGYGVASTVANAPADVPTTTTLFGGVPSVTEAPAGKEALPSGNSFCQSSLSSSAFSFKPPGLPVKPPASPAADKPKRNKSKKVLCAGINLLKHLDNSQISDVEFVVEPQTHCTSRTIRAHKQFLAMRNDAFLAMFYGTPPEGAEVVISDLHPDGFYGFLKYIYTGTCKPDTFEEAMYTRQAAEKYKVPEVIAVCSEYIAQHISADKVCPLLDCLATSDIEQVDEAALYILKSDAESVLTSESFVYALECTVECVLETIVGVPEICVMESVFRWAEHISQNSSAKEDPAVVLKSILRPFLPKLRFLALTAPEFVQGPAAWGMLEESEGYAILKNIVVRNSVPLPEWVCTEDVPRS